MSWDSTSASESVLLHQLVEITACNRGASCGERNVSAGSFEHGGQVFALPGSDQTVFGLFERQLGVIAKLGLLAQSFAGRFEPEHLRRERRWPRCDERGALEHIANL